MERFKGKTAIITGSTSGIGKGIARRLASEGANVVINSYREHEDTTDILAEITSSGGEAVFIQADMSKTDEIDHLIDRSVAHFGRVDILVNNAGIQIHSPFLDVKEKDFDKVISV